MTLALAVSRYAYAAGRLDGAWRFASRDLKKMAGFARISAAWQTFRRDAGRGEIGRDHIAAQREDALLITNDPRRDSVLLWLAAQGSAPIAEDAAVLARAANAVHPFGGSARELLETACDVIAMPPSPDGAVARIIAREVPVNDPAMLLLLIIATTIDRLRAHPGFLEGIGEEVRHELPQGVLRHYVPAEAGGAWALNLALLARGNPDLSSLAPGLASRALFRASLTPEDVALELVGNATAGLVAGYDRLEGLAVQLLRGDVELRHLSRNARMRDAWSLVAATDAVTRRQLSAALGLSRAGADIQARGLAEARLATLGSGGLIRWAAVGSRLETVPILEPTALGGTLAAFDATMADIDRLLARHESDVSASSEVWIGVKA